MLESSSLVTSRITEFSDPVSPGHRGLQATQRQYHCSLLICCSCSAYKYFVHYEPWSTNFLLIVNWTCYTIIREQLVLYSFYMAAADGYPSEDDVGGMDPYKSEIFQLVCLSILGIFWIAHLIKIRNVSWVFLHPCFSIVLSLTPGTPHIVVFQNSCSTRTQELNHVRQ